MIRRTFATFAAAASLLVASPALADGVHVEVGHNRLSPAEVTVAVGQPVHFQNLDEMPGGHTIVADDGSFASPGLAKGESWHHTFAEPGVYPYHIEEHPGAKGRAIVVEKLPEPASKP
jgi:plastocyanin